MCGAVRFPDAFHTPNDLKGSQYHDLKSPFNTVALTMMALLEFENNENACFEMLEYLNGPDEVSNYTHGFIKERFNKQKYVARSFFGGATAQNNYTPNKPYTLTVSSGPYSYPDENWATLYVKSSGADSDRYIKLRKKPSTGEWFVNDIQCLQDIRLAQSEDKWA